MLFVADADGTRGLHHDKDAVQAIVGFEVPIERLEGKFKLNQNRSRADREGVVRALSRSPDTVLRRVAELMRETLDEDVR